MLRRLALRGTSIILKEKIKRSLLTSFLSIVNDTGHTANFHRELSNVASTDINDEDFKSQKSVKIWKGKRTRPRLKRQKKQTKIPVLSLTQARSLYDKLAPHVRLTLIRDICVLLKKKKSSAGIYQDIVNGLWGTGAASFKKAPPFWAQQEIKFALLNGKIQERSDWTRNTDFAPLVNRENWQRHVEILRRAREHSLHSRLWWSRAQKENLFEQLCLSVSESSNIKNNESNEAKLDEELASKVCDMNSERQARYDDKSETQLQKEAETLLEHLADNLPSEPFLELINFFDTFTFNLSKYNKREKFLLPNIEKCVKAHSPIVAPAIAEFIYLNTMALDFESGQIIKFTNEWDMLRERFAKILPEFQQAHKKKQSQDKFDNDREATAAKINSEIRAELEQETKIGDESTKVTNNRRQFMVRCDVMMLTDNLPSVPDSDRMIFVDNLPIDISEMELFEIYTPCGPIQSISIFNQRHDLDPGKLSAVQLQERRKKMRKNRISPVTNRKGWQRRKTPLYAYITFATVEGAQKALMPELQLLGMIFRKHDMRSLQVSALKKLYVENLPKGLHSSDLEYQLATSLKEHDMYLSLRLGQHKKTEPTSCEIFFPSFDVAFLSYDKVNESIASLCEHYESENCDTVINWIPTPIDAMKHWTREIGFD